MTARLTVSGWVARVEESKQQGVCAVCLQPVAGRIHTPDGEREYRISGCCEVCFERMVGEEE